MRGFVSLPVLVVAISLWSAACGTGTETADRAVPGTSSTTLGAVEPSIGATVEQAAALRSGFPAGVVESFEHFDDVKALKRRVDATVVGRFDGYELNPASGEGPNLLTPGYAGGSGVVRVHLHLERSLNGPAADVAEAPGHAGEGLIAVDLPYWMPERHQAEHFEQLDALIGARFIMFLTNGAVGSEMTGAYQLWEDPFAAFAEGVDGTAVRVLHDRRLILQDAIERGAKAHPESSVSLESVGVPDDPLPDILTPLEGRPFDEVVTELQE